MSEEGFLKEGRAKGREITCQFWTLNTIYLLAIIDQNWIQETRTSIVVLSIVLWMSLATCQEKCRKEMSHLQTVLVAVLIRCIFMQEFRGNIS